MIRVFYSDRYTIDLPEGHKFPMAKYRLIREALVDRKVVESEWIFASPLAEVEQVKLAHSSEYVDAVCDLSLDRKIVRRIGFPLTNDLVLRSLATVGGAIAAADSALELGLGGNLAGGTHHALWDAGEGFCVFNDVAVAVLWLLQHRRISRAAIIDLDVHQGNGNSAILGDLESVFVFSMHGQSNYPFIKVPSTLDIGLPTGTGDEEYLAHLRKALPRIQAFRPDIVFYLSGSDPLEQDSLGKLSLSMEGLAERDRIVFEFSKRMGVPLSMALGGGYAKPLSVIVDAHVQTYRVVREVYRF